MSGTRAGELDLDAYLERTGYRGPLEPTAATLAGLHRHHVLAIPFENLEIMLGRPVELDLASLQAKLVMRRRGGYCYEHNLLFAAVLERLGYTFTLEARWPVDYTVLNWYTSTHPRSPFTQRPVIQQAGDSLRRSVVGDELAVIHPGWARDTRAVAPGGLPEIVAAEFGIELTAQDADTLRRL